MKQLSVVIYSEFDWLCPVCGHVNHEWVTEDGPTLEVLCECCSFLVPIDEARLPINPSQDTKPDEPPDRDNQC